MLEPPRSSPSAASPRSAFIACSPTPRSTSVKQRERLTKTLINAVGEARRWPLHQFLPCDSTAARVPSERLQTGISPVCCAGAARAAGGDRKGVGEGKGVSGHVDMGGRRVIKKKKKKQ